MKIEDYEIITYIEENYPFFLAPKHETMSITWCIPNSHGYLKLYKNEQDIYITWKNMKFLLEKDGFFHKKSLEHFFQLEELPLNSEGFLPLQAFLDHK